jgi:hypothetical protein
MTSSTSERTRHEIYNHSRSKERRAPPAKPDPVAVLRERHYDEKATLGTRHRRESVDLEQKFNQERARDPYRNDPPNADKRRRDLQKKHEVERDAMEQRHRTELTTAAAKNPLP